MVTERFLVYPADAPTDLVRSLDLGGIEWDGRDRLSGADDNKEFTGAIVVIDEEPEAAWAMCRALRKRDVPVDPLLVLIPGSMLDQLDGRDDLFDDFLISPFHPREFEVRIGHLLWRAGRGVRPELVSHGPISLNVETYQAALDGKVMDLTYMEYELLRHLTSHPGKVFSREALLNQVWGYDYYGGARTVDVHVRRLRAKLGEEHSHLIQTVRSVGYKLGQTRWS
jgi:DNA-binding response OmpR family regulator